jgi:hypothetical protein
LFEHRYGGTMSDSVQPVTHPREYLPVLEGVEMALDAACGALMALQSIDVRCTAGDSQGVEGHVAQTIWHLRRAIDELRDAHTKGHTGLALGFVLARDAHNSNGEGRFG